MLIRVIECDHRVQVRDRLQAGPLFPLWAEGPGSTYQSLQCQLTFSQEGTEALGCCPPCHQVLSLLPTRCIPWPGQRPAGRSASSSACLPRCCWVCSRANETMAAHIPGSRCRCQFTFNRHSWASMKGFARGLQHRHFSPWSLLFPLTAAAFALGCSRIHCFSTTLVGSCFSDPDQPATALASPWPAPSALILPFIRSLCVHHPLGLSRVATELQVLRHEL